LPRPPTTTKFTKIVVTDDQGRFVIPDLRRRYEVWVRGYAWWIRPSCAPARQLLNLTAVLAPNEAAAAHYYPAIYYSRAEDSAALFGHTDIPKEITG